MDGAFARLVDQVQACRRCPSMHGRRRVLGAANGPLGASILLVGEAPGRLGADRTGVPFVGDASGRRLDRLLAEAGWGRGDVFITNAVLCNPRDALGHNRPPTAGELLACRGHLAATIAYLEPRLVVALGRRALAALGAIQPHPLQGGPPAVVVDWAEGRWLTWMVHPSPLAAARRPWAVQCQDWRRLRRAADALLALR